MAPATNCGCRLRVDGFTSRVRVVRSEPGPLTGESILTLEDERGTQSRWRTLLHAPEPVTGLVVGELSCGRR